MVRQSEIPVSARQASGHLATKYAHERDARIYFDEEPHIYYVDWFNTGDFTRADKSVTTIVKSGFKPFVAKHAINGMKKSKDWPRLPYVVTNEDEVPILNAFGNMIPMTDEAIEQMWSSDGKAAAELGTAMHASFECYLNTADDTKYDARITKEFHMFMHYLDEKYPDVPMRPFRTEIMFFGVFNNRKVCGSVDLLELVSINHETKKIQLKIGDFKRSKKLEFNSRYGNGFGPCAHLANVNGQHYRLQLNMYRLMGEQFYNKWTIDGVEYDVEYVGMYLLVCHENREDAARIEVDRLDDSLMLSILEHAFDNEYFFKPPPPKRQRLTKTKPNQQTNDNTTE